MKRGYSPAFVPPAPVVEVSLTKPGAHESVLLEGKIDMGADLCCVPEAVIGRLDLAPVRVVRAAGFSGTPAEALVYRIDVTIEGRTSHAVEALATRRWYAIIGRNVLRGWVLRLDGPCETLEIRASVTRRARR
jgi:predicted aspartyl protease